VKPNYRAIGRVAFGQWKEQGWMAFSPFTIGFFGECLDHCPLGTIPKGMSWLVNTLEMIKILVKLAG
jgi:hypothetical protein